MMNQIKDFDAGTKILGFNISGIKTIVVYGDMNGMVYERLQMETSADLPFLESLDEICNLADKLLKLCRAQGLSSPQAISLAISGPVDFLKGMILSPADLPHWESAPLKGRLSVRYNLPVFFEQRSNAAALAEANFGAGVGTEDLILLDMEPVLTAGLMLGGRIYHGANAAAGEIGKVKIVDDGPAGLGEPGSLTGFASGHGMAELASLRFPKRFPEQPRPYEFVKTVRDGDEAAQQVVQEAANHLGRALLGLIFTLDPELVVVGHPGDLLGENLLTPLRDAVLRYGGGNARQLPRLEASKLGAKLDDVAALAAVIDIFRHRNQE